MITAGLEQYAKTADGVDKIKAGLSDNSQQGGRLEASDWMFTACKHRDFIRSCISFSLFTPKVDRNGRRLTIRHRYLQTESPR